MRIVVIGGSAAGGSLCETARALDPSVEIALVTREPWPMYSRCLLPKFISGVRTRRQLEFRPADWANRHTVRVIAGTATRISLHARVVEVDTGERLQYDRLAVATGARAVLPRVPGIDVRGVFNLYTLESADGVKAWLPIAHKIIVLGAGLIGMKSAAAFVHLNKQVVIVEQKSTVLPDTLDPEAAAMMSRLFTSRGVQVRTSETISEVNADRRGRIRAVRLASGEKIDCDMLVCAVGTRPNAELVSQAGGKTDVGIWVDERMQTSLPDVFAIGDAAEAPMLNTTRVLKTANWFNSSWEGRLCAFNMLGEKTAYGGRLRANAVELLGTPFVSVGLVQTQDGEAQVLYEPAKQCYRKLVMQDDRLVGFILLGDIAEAGVLTGLIQNGHDLSSIQDRLLSEGAGVVPTASSARFRKNAGQGLATDISRPSL